MQNSEVIVTGQVAGSFDESPVSLDYHFILEGGQIGALKILG